jgi:anti-anti-sigma factor
VNELELNAAVREEAGEDLCFVTAAGDVDLANAESLGEALAAPECANSAGLVLDLREVGFMDSSGLAVVLEASRAKGSRLVVVNAENSAVERLFEITDSDQHIARVTSPEAAIAKLGSGDGS